jgi:hypothetical protein
LLDVNYVKALTRGGKAGKRPGWLKKQCSRLAGGRRRLPWSAGSESESLSDGPPQEIRRRLNYLSRNRTSNSWCTTMQNGQIVYGSRCKTRYRCYHGSRKIKAGRGSEKLGVESLSVCNRARLPQSFVCAPINESTQNTYSGFKSTLNAPRKQQLHIMKTSRLRSSFMRHSPSYGIYENH